MPEALLVDGSREVSLADVHPAGDDSLPDPEAAREFQDVASELLELQGLVQAAEKHGVLIVLQGMDAAGKDLTIQQALGAANPEAIRVKHFSEMSEEEALHDIFWRAHLAAPQRGEWVVFDRSYYEQIVEPIVDGEASDDETAERCADAREFERILRNGGTVVVKLFLHVSPEEQERRLIERMAADETAWKISASDCRTGAVGTSTWPRGKWSSTRRRRVTRPGSSFPPTAMQDGISRPPKHSSTAFGRTAPSGLRRGHASGIRSARRRYRKRQATSATRSAR